MNNWKFSASNPYVPILVGAACFLRALLCAVNPMLRHAARQSCNNLIGITLNCVLVLVQLRGRG
jgi:hypothetical protein